MIVCKCVNMYIEYVCIQFNKIYIAYNNFATYNI